LRPEKLPYGPHRSQFCELWLPDGDGPHPVAVLLHGGAWRAHYGRQLMWPLAADLRERGWAAWNVEYRRLGEGGGWPATFDDVAAAIDALADRPEPLDLGTVVAVGHSAGGQLAVWAGARADARVPVTAVVAQAGQLDLEHIARAGLSDSAVPELLGGMPEEVPERYAAASPARLLPLPVPVLVVHGDEDRLAPAAAGRRFAEAAGDGCALVVTPGEGHVAHLEPDSEAWRVTLRFLEAQRAGRAGSPPPRAAPP